VKSSATRDATAAEDFTVETEQTRRDGWQRLIDPVAQPD
jgi:hypothetical protein